MCSRTRTFRQLRAIPDFITKLIFIQRQFATILGNAYRRHRCGYLQVMRTSPLWGVTVRHRARILRRVMVILLYFLQVIRHFGPDEVNHMCD